MPISFTLPIHAIPVQTGGKRMAIHNGKPMFFKDKRTSSYLQNVTLLSAQYRPEAPLEGPLRVVLAFVLPRPLRLAGAKHSQWRLHAPVRPDWDNLCKGLLDALKGFWLDDAQICSAVVHKYYTSKGEAPCVEVQISQLPE